LIKIGGWHNLDAIAGGDRFDLSPPPIVGLWYWCTDQ